MAMYTSLTGLNAAQTDLSTTSNNIANVGTVGFKRSRAEFGDIISSSALQSAGRVAGSGTALKTIKQQFTQGAIQSSLNVMDLAMMGEGFFMVKSTSGTTDMQFTRNGSFSVNNERFVVDSGGQALQVYPVNDSGTVISTSINDTRALRLPLTSGQPRATTGINLALNLPSDAEVIPNNPIFTPANPYAFNPGNPATYNRSTSTTVYDSLGNPMAAEIYYVRMSSSNSSATTNDWNVHVIVDGTELTPSSGPSPMQLRFDNFGQIVSPTGGVAFDPLTIPGGDPLLVSINHGTSTTQYSDPFSIVSLTQDGYPSGRLDSVTVDNNGVVRASFTNGQTQALGKVAVATFANANGLKQTGDAHYTATGLSGEPILGEAGASGVGTIRSGALEMANVDITEELVNLITAQRNFQANAKAIETDSVMTSAIINIRS
ncbi:flagellar hook protein FlgE [Sphingosinicella microcystinivorans]|uniref:flagellar hook protein FlgE n=1 Tax=Sphingosinicella microcystinivorans TaxID=335406 RepID=UPI0022F3BB12|nr:flagellar hook protein FlgE [Sphingosinicella microcystinivorans]WBX82367.1 flagellar hook protein FlgE [Sphingosinicella microcystinivorans]